MGEWDLEFNIDEPEKCKCVGATTMGSTRVTAKWIKKLGKLKWEEQVYWDPLDLDTTCEFSEVLPESIVLRFMRI